ncbi:MAG: glycine oxidase ThiO [Acidobacteria bacterium]|nr:glycine oxidase ThiO [Acidobacteriota bacterium]
MMRVAIVGAGVIGAAVAEALAARGTQVEMFDVRAPGAGASQASAGVLCPYIEATPGSALLTLGTRSLAMWDDFASGIRERSGRSVEYQRTGTLEVALTDVERSHLRASADWLSTQGVPHTWLEDGALLACEPSVFPAARAGLFIHDHGFINVPQLVSALLQAARLQGATIETPREILHVDPEPAGAVRLRVDGDWREYDACVLAAGSWTGRVRVSGLSALPVRPIRGQLLHLTWNGPAVPTRSIWGTQCYTVPWSDGSLLVGATVEDVGFDENSTAEGVAGLLDAVRALLPDARSAAVREVRVGLRPATADALPLLGPWPTCPRLVVAAGHYRNGILLAPLTADVVTRLLVDEDVDQALAITRPDRHL